MSGLRSRPSCPSSWGRFPPPGKGIRLLGVTLSSLAAGTEAGVEQQFRLPI
jgi:hypothetical protein